MCKVDGCQYRCLRENMKQHYTGQHKMSESKAKQLIPAHMTMSKLTTPIRCMFCDHIANAILIRIHITKVHMKNENLSIEEVDLMIEGIFDKDSKKGIKKLNEISMANSKQNRRQCLAPGCKLIIDSKSMSR